MIKLSIHILLTFRLYFLKVVCLRKQFFFLLTYHFKCKSGIVLFILSYNLLSQVGGYTTKQNNVNSNINNEQKIKIPTIVCPVISNSQYLIEEKIFISCTSPYTFLYMSAFCANARFYLILLHTLLRSPIDILPPLSILLSNYPNFLFIHP